MRPSVPCPCPRVRPGTQRWTPHNRAAPRVRARAQLSTQQDLAARASRDAEVRVQAIQQQADQGVSDVERLAAQLREREQELAETRKQLDDTRAAGQVRAELRGGERRGASDRDEVLSPQRACIPLYLPCPCSQTAQAELDTQAQGMASAVEQTMALMAAREQEVQQLRQQLEQATAQARPVQGAQERARCGRNEQRRTSPSTSVVCVQAARDAEAKAQELAAVRQNLEAALARARQEASHSQQQLTQVRRCGRPARAHGCVGMLFPHPAVPGMFVPLAYLAGAHRCSRRWSPSWPPTWSTSRPAHHPPQPRAAAAPSRPRRRAPPGRPSRRPGCAQL